MWYLIALFSILFLFVGLILQIEVAKTLNPITAYLLYQMNFLFSHLVLFVSGITLLVLFFIYSHDPRHHPLHQKFFHSVVQVFSVVFVGLSLACAFLFFLGILQLNTLSVLVNINPSFVGAVTNTEVIKKRLSEATTTPTIVASEKEPHKELLAIAMTQSGDSNFYGKYILPSIPPFLILPVKDQESSLLMVDNTLVFTQIDPEELASISPILGFLLVKEHFKTRYIKPPPDVAIMGKNEYVKAREEDMIIKTKRVDQEIQKIESMVSSLSASIQKGKDDEKTGTSSLNRIISQRNASVRSCIASGVTQAICEERLAEQNSEIEKENNEGIKRKEKVKKDEALLKEYQSYNTFYTAQKKLLSSQKGNFSHELGVFNPEKSLRIALDTKSPHAIADYLETLTHEYLHYSGYSPERKFAGSFFEEALTEYFARQIIEESLGIQTNLGYPLQVKIIAGINTMITDSELAEIYFSKDEKVLEAALNRVYGDGFYTNNAVLFETLQYTSDPQQALTTANSIMDRIGGEDLTKKDLMSSYSNL